MNVQAEKMELLKMLLETDNPSIIKSIKNIFEANKDVDFWNELRTDQKQEIKEALLEIDNGQTSDYEAFMSKHR